MGRECAWGLRGPGAGRGGTHRLRLLLEEVGLKDLPVMLGQVCVDQLLEERWYGLLNAGGVEGQLGAAALVRRNLRLRHHFLVLVLQRFGGGKVFVALSKP